jgi:hypothetical protein
MATDPTSEPIALIDLDGTLADYSGAMQRDLMTLCTPDEIAHTNLSGLRWDFHALEAQGPHWKARMDLIKSQPGWWANLARLEQNFRVVEALRTYGFDLHILTKGPWSKSRAWMEKVDWCQRYVADAEIHITGAQTGKGMVYGKVLFDDYPPYVESWLRWRKRGLAILPAHPWNAGFSHPNAIRWDGSDAAWAAICERLSVLRATSK